jgi:hypothetical protein
VLDACCCACHTTLNEKVHCMRNTVRLHGERHLKFTVSLVAALSGVDVARCLVILMLAPTVTVVGSEVRVAETPSP